MAFAGVKSRVSTSPDTHVCGQISSCHGFVKPHRYEGMGLDAPGPFKPYSTTNHIQPIFKPYDKPYDKPYSNHTTSHTTNHTQIMRRAIRQTIRQTTQTIRQTILNPYSNHTETINHTHGLIQRRNNWRVLTHISPFDSIHSKCFIVTTDNHPPQYMEVLS